MYTIFETDPVTGLPRPVRNVGIDWTNGGWYSQDVKTGVTTTGHRLQDVVQPGKSSGDTRRHPRRY